MTTRRTPRRRRRLRSALCATIGLVALLGAGCGSDAGGDETTARSTSSSSTPVDLSDVDWVDLSDEAEVVIQSRDNTFRPGYVVVRAGTPITFRNVGRTEHNALPVDEISFEGIEAEELEPRAERTITLDEPGDHPYYCSLHGTTTKGMVGAIRVVE
jgi:plastocyanin